MIWKVKKNYKVIVVIHNTTSGTGYDDKKKDLKIFANINC